MGYLTWGDKMWVVALSLLCAKAVKAAWRVRVRGKEKRKWENTSPAFLITVQFLALVLHNICLSSWPYTHEFIQSPHNEFLYTWNHWEWISVTWQSKEICLQLYFNVPRTVPNMWQLACLVTTSCALSMKSLEILKRFLRKSKEWTEISFLLLLGGPVKTIDRDISFRW